MLRLRHLYSGYEKSIRNICFKMSFQNAVPVLIVSYSSNTKREEVNFNLKNSQRAGYGTSTHDPQQKSDVLDIPACIPACHAGDRGSIPSRGELFLYLFFLVFPLSKPIKANISGDKTFLNDETT